MKKVLQAKREVILAAGAIGSPNILMQSGIGDSAELTGVGVTPVLNHPSVGKNLTDHIQLVTLYASNSSSPLNRLVLYLTSATLALIIFPVIQH